MGDVGDAWVIVESSDDNMLLSVGAWVDDKKLPSLDEALTLDLPRDEKAGTAANSKHHNSVPSDKDCSVQSEQDPNKHDGCVKAYLAKRSSHKPAIGPWLASLPLKQDPVPKNVVERR